MGLCLYICIFYFQIVFLNAFKMKISIILGVLHMTFGVCMSFWNHKYFQKPVNIFTEFIPQLLFLLCLFGYLALLMFFKWTKYYANKVEDEFGLSERCAPSILITFINMVLFRGNKAEAGCDPYIYGGEREIQSILVRFYFFFLTFCFYCVLSFSLLFGMVACLFLYCLVLVSSTIVLPNRLTYIC